MIPRILPTLARVPLRTPAAAAAAAAAATTPWRRFSSAVTPAPESRLSRDGVAGRPIDFDTQAKIEGNESQIVTITLEPGQVLRAESGAMMYM